MNTSSSCPTCGEPIPPEAPDGLCPKCVLSGVLEQSSPPPAESSIEEAREKFSGYEVIELIGMGGIGRVYKARDTRMDRVVALKVLSPDRVEDPEWIERFTREARALARLNHRHIVQVHAFGTEPQPHLVMEFVDGLNLRQVMESGGLSAREALVIVPKLCDALHYAHEHGVLHRDIKPENVLVDDEGRVKLVDFGLAKLHDEDALPFTLTQSGAKLGTIAYMAPEQVEKPSDVDHRADIYSLGVVLYEMLTGELPLGRFPSPSEANGTDPRLDEVVLRTLEKKKEKRFPDAETMGSEIEHATRVVASAPGKKSTASLRASAKNLWRSPWRLATLLLALSVMGLLGWVAMREQVVSESSQLIAEQEAEARQQEEARRKSEAEREERRRYMELGQGWITEASRTDDPKAKAKAIEEMLATLSSDDPVAIRAALRSFTNLSDVRMDRSVFQEPIRQLLGSMDWKIRSYAISALFATEYEPSDVEMILGMIETIPEEHLSAISGALGTVSESDFTGEYTGPMLRLLERGFEAQKQLPPSGTSMPNRYLLGVLWGARVSPEIESLVIDWTRLDTTEEKDMSTNSPGYYAFYSALSVFANKSTPSVKRLLELASNPDSTNIGGRCLWGLNGTVSDKADQELVASSVVQILGERNDEYTWRRGTELLRKYASAEQVSDLSKLAGREGMSVKRKEALTSIIDSLSP